MLHFCFWTARSEVIKRRRGGTTVSCHSPLACTTKPRSPGAERDERRGEEGEDGRRVANRAGAKKYIQGKDLGAVLNQNNCEGFEITETFLKQNSERFLGTWQGSW